MEWEAFVGVLAGSHPAPSSGFISHTGPLDEQQIKQLHVALAGASAVFGFRLEGCALGDAGAHSVALALAGNKHLDSVELPDNDIGAAGANALSIMMESNKTIIALSLEGNPCEEEAPEILERIDRHVERNRNLQRGPNRAEASPLANQRAQRTRARIMEISVDAVPYAASEYDTPHEHDADRHSTRSEQLSARSDPATAVGDVAARLFDLERRQRHSEDLGRKLEDDGEALQEWRHAMEQKTQAAVAELKQYVARVEEHKAQLVELQEWRTTAERIVDGCSMRVQRQGGDFHGLREKVMQLDTALDRLRRANAAAALPLPATPPVAPATPQPAGDGGDRLAAAVSGRLAELEAAYQNVCDELGKISSEIQRAMDGFADGEAGNANAHADFEQRLQALERVGQIQEEGPAPAELAAGLQELRADTHARLQQLEGLSAAIASHAEATSRIETARQRADAAHHASSCMAEELAMNTTQQVQLRQNIEAHAQRLSGLELSAHDTTEQLAGARASREETKAQVDSLAEEQEYFAADLAALREDVQAQGEQVQGLLASRASSQTAELGEQDRRNLAAVGATAEEAAGLARGTAQTLASLEGQVAAAAEGSVAAAAAAAAASAGLAAAEGRLGASLGLAMRHVGVLEEQMQHYAVQERANVSFRDAVTSKIRALEAGQQALINSRAEAEAGGGLPRRVEMLELQVAALADGLAAAEQRQAPPSPVSPVAVPVAVMAASAQEFPASFALLDIDEDYLADEPFPQRPATPEQAGTSAAGELQGMQRSVARLQEEMRAVRKQLKREASGARPSRPVDSAGVLLPRQQQ